MGLALFCPVLFRILAEKVRMHFMSQAIKIKEPIMLNFDGAGGDIILMEGSRCYVIEYRKDMVPGSEQKLPKSKREVSITRMPHK